MGEIKKNASVPPIRLRDEIIKLSVSNDWESAKGEWKFKIFRIVQGYKACLCSPRGIRNIILIVNELNDNKLEICNSCAERYFGFQEGTKLAYCVRRIKADIEYNMAEFPLKYLEDNKITSTHDTICYNKARGFRNVQMLLFYISEINKRMLLFTDYNNKDVFDKLDRILVWMVQRHSEDINNLINKRDTFLNTGEIDVEELNSLINENNIGTYDSQLLESTKEMLMKDYKHLNDAVMLFHPSARRRHRSPYKDIENEDMQSEEEYCFSNSLKTCGLDEYPDLEKKDEYDQTEELIMEGFTDETRCHDLSHNIYDWIEELMSQESGKNIAYDVNSYITSSVPIYRILDFLGIQKLHEVCRQEGATNIMTLLQESDLPIDYTYKVLDVLIKKSDIRLQIEWIGRINRLLKEIGLKLSSKSPVKFVPID